MESAYTQDGLYAYMLPLAVTAGYMDMFFDCLCVCVSVNYHILKAC